MGGGGIEPQGFFRGAAPKRPENGRGDDEIEQGGGNESPDNDDGHGVEDFFSRFIGGEQERDQRGTGGQRSHEDGNKPLLGAADDHLCGKPLSFVTHEVKVM